MIQVSKDIHPFFLTINDPAKEKEFLEWSFPGQFNFLKKMVYTGIAATILFTIPDYLKSGLNKPFLLSLMSRVIFCVAVFLVLKTIQLLKKPAVFHGSLFALSTVITINTTYVIITMQNHSVVYALSEIIGIIVVYVLLRQRFLYSLLSGIPASMVIMMSHVLYGNLDDSSLQTILYAFILANILGIGYNRNINLSIRKEYLSLRYEQNLNARLEKEIEQRVNAQNDLLEMARTDYLTGLYNRRFFMELAEQEIFKCERYKQALALLTLDIDNFKLINDKYGHHEGDTVLIETARKIKSQIRKSDILSRIGGEEFLIAAPSTSINEAQIMAENLRKFIFESQLGTKKNIKISISIGVAQYNMGETLIDLMEKSDKAMYMAKESGRNRVVVFDEKSPV